jgi:N utilization substance protein B
MLFFKYLKYKILVFFKKIWYTKILNDYFILLYFDKMSVNRARTRKLLFQELYARKFHHFDAISFYESFYQGTFTFEIDTKYMQEIIEIIAKHESFFQAVIQKYAPKFDVKNMSLIYILPLYIALSEMFFLDEEIPAKVSMNEAIEIAKTYSDESGKKIINGILNKVFENYEDIKTNLLPTFSS